MPLVPLQQPTWWYDDENNTLVVVFAISASGDNPDPASYIPEFEYRIEVPLPPSKAPSKQSRNLSQPE